MIRTRLRRVNRREDINKVILKVSSNVLEAAAFGFLWLWHGSA
jgi:hypothetical protein